MKVKTGASRIARVVITYAAQNSLYTEYWVCLKPEGKKIPSPKIAWLQKILHSCCLGISPLAYIQFPSQPT